jgi:hypothetical protein
MANKGIGYNSRNFADIRTDLVNMVDSITQTYLTILTMLQ